MRKEFLACSLSAVLVLTAPCAALPVYAAPQVSYVNTAVAGDADDIDPLAYTRSEECTLPVVGDSVSGNSEALMQAASLKKDDSRFTGAGLHYGIDVSKWDNYNETTKKYEPIDWQKVRAAGVEYVFVRMGYRTLAKSGGIYADPYGTQNLKGAIEAGLKVGVYIYSQALTENEAREEAQWLLNSVGEYKSQITLPFVDDYEYGEYSENGRTVSGRFSAKAISKEQKTKNALAFMKTIENAGSTPMFYGNRNFFMEDINMSAIDSDYLVWLARYVSAEKKISAADYKGNYSYWQFGSAKGIDGIPASLVDVNIWYDQGIFVDVPVKSYYKGSVDWAVSHDVTSGIGKVAFGPGQSCTRAQIVSFLHRVQGQPKAETNYASFADITSTAWYYNAVRWAAESGVTSGVSDNAFGPSEVCTRAQAVTFLWRALGKPAAKANPTKFSDVTDSYYTDALNWATTNGVVSGTSKTTFSPNEKCTRAQIVTMFYNAYKEKLGS